MRILRVGLANRHIRIFRRFIRLPYRRQSWLGRATKFLFDHVDASLESGTPDTGDGFQAGQTAKARRGPPCAVTPECRDKVAGVPKCKSARL